jgi:hypothetical protein
MTTAIPDFVRTITTQTPCAKNPNRWHSKNDTDLEYARRRCAICPHQIACLDWAMEHRNEVGMWGGLTRRQRANRRGDTPDTEEHEDRQEAPARPKCPCGRTLTTNDNRVCYLHRAGVPLLSPLLIATLTAALDEPTHAVLAGRLGITPDAAVGRLRAIYRRLGVNGLYPSRRRPAAIEAARAAGLLPVEQGAAA